MDFQKLTKLMTLKPNYNQKKIITSIIKIIKVIVPLIKIKYIFGKKILKSKKLANPKTN